MMKLQSTLLFLLAALNGFGQAAPALQRTPLTTNINGALIQSTRFQNMVSEEAKTNRIDGGGSSGKYVTENVAGSISGVFSNWWKYGNNGNRVAVEWQSLPGSGAYDYSFGLNVVDPTAETFQQVFSYNNATADSVFRFWKPIQLTNLTLSTSPAAGIALDANGVTVKTAPPITTLPMMNSDMVLDDFSTYAATTTPTFSGGFGFLTNGVYTSTAHIASRQMLDGITRNVLRLLGKGDYVRPLPWGTNWTHVRIGVLFGITNNTLSFTNAFAFGLVANGTNGGLFGNNCSNFFGFGNAGRASTDHTFAYSNQLDVAFLDGVFTDRGVIRTNNTTVNNASGSGSASRALAALPHFGAWFIDYERPLNVTWPTTNVTATITLRGQIMIPASASSIITKRIGMNAFLYDLQNIQAAWSIVSASGVAFSGTAINERFFGAFDSVDLAWGSATNMVEIWAIGAAKIH